ncbi:MAG: molybdopterin-dependent oxidoreductase [Candidatus Rokubacteria bacterium]|nr:molybdopterin-dependent oxidoreductase [Candidatus Rokubacteria bacterium]
MTPVNASRREFLKAGLTAGVALGLADPALALSALRPTVEVGNPLEHYPARDWERVYRDQYRYDGSFTWVCSPNCTHECRLRGFVRNGVFLRSEQNYDSHRIGDLHGNRASVAWNPRGCLNGFTFQRRVYGPYRLRYPLIRKGWKRWADDGFPELTPETLSRYKFDARGQDELLRATWDEAYTYAAKGMIAIAQLFRSTQTMLFRYEIKEGPKVHETEINGTPWAMYNDTVIGYDRAGREAVRVTVEEPIHVRSAQYANSI